MSHFKIAIKMFLLMLVLTGGIYPLLVTVLAQSLLPELANGSLVKDQDKIIGSQLIAQEFKGDNFFWPRPSAIGFNPLAPSGGSNLGPTSLKLMQIVEQRAKKNQSDAALTPTELLYASGSGVDPHISIEAAYFQVERITKARSFSDNTSLIALIDSLAEGKNRKYVNVLMLNLALNKQFSTGLQKE